MTQYDETVERQRLLLEAEEWSKGVSSLHTHRTASMWYETDLSAMTDFNNGHVTDVQYNSGVIERTQNGEVIRLFGTPKTGDELIGAYTRSQQR